LPVESVGGKKGKRTQKGSGWGRNPWEKAKKKSSIWEAVSDQKVRWVVGGTIGSEGLGQQIDLGKIL